MAMAAYVLARTGKPEGGLNARLYEARAALPLFGRAMLLRAMKLGKAPADQLATLTRELSEAVVVDTRAATASVDESPRIRAGSVASSISSRASRTASMYSRVFPLPVTPCNNNVLPSAESIAETTRSSAVDWSLVSE